MFIRLSIEQINSILKMGKSFISKDDARPLFTHILLIADGEELTAVAVNDASLCELKLKYKNIDGINGTMLIPMVPLFKKNDQFCTISQDDKETTFTTMSTSLTFQRTDCDSKPLRDYKRFYPADDLILETFYVNPKLLTTALNAFSEDECVRIDYYGIVSGIAVTGLNKKALVLPMNPKGESAQKLSKNTKF